MYLWNTNFSNPQKAFREKFKAPYSTIVAL